MNEIKKVFEGQEIRVVENGGEPWFVLADVCTALGIQNVSETASRLDDDEKLNRSDLLSLGQRGGWTVNEFGIYSVILRSDKPEAKRFKKWITSEVLPSIRKTGGYLSPSVDFTDPDNLQKVFDSWKEERRKRIEAEARTSRLIHNNRTYPSTEIAKELGMKSAQELHKALSSKGILYKDKRGIWLLYSEYADKGFQRIGQKEVNGIIVYYSEWTGVGRDWLIGLFSKDKSC